jgi:hypothetical protein
MRKTTAQAAVRPEQYHLTEAPKLRAKLREEADAAAEKETAALRSAAAAAIYKGIGITVPASAEFIESSYYPGFQIGKCLVTVHEPSLKYGADNAPATIRAAHKRAEHLSHRARGVCKLISTQSARQFGAFCRTKYGPKPSLDTIRTAHAEWLDLQLNCKC